MSGVAYSLVFGFKLHIGIGQPVARLSEEREALLEEFLRQGTGSQLLGEKERAQRQRWPSHSQAVPRASPSPLFCPPHPPPFPPPPPAPRPPWCRDRPPGAGRGPAAAMGTGAGPAAPPAAPRPRGPGSSEPVPPAPQALCEPAPLTGWVTSAVVSVSTEQQDYFGGKGPLCAPQLKTAPV